MIKVKENIKNIEEYEGFKIFTLDRFNIDEYTIGPKTRNAFKLPFSNKKIDGMYATIIGKFNISYPALIYIEEGLDGNKYLKINKLNQIFDNKVDAIQYAKKRIDEEIKRLNKKKENFDKGL